MGKLLIPVSGSGLTNDGPEIGGQECPPDYYALASQLADLSRQVAARAEEDGDGRLERTAARIGACAASMMHDLNRSTI